MHFVSFWKGKINVSIESDISVKLEVYLKACGTIIQQKIIKYSKSMFKHDTISTGQQKKREAIATISFPF